jgi:Zn-dependent protease
MLLFEPAETQFDLRWRMFGIPVRVHPMFWLVTAILGWDLVQAAGGVRLLVVWIACVFVSVLLHELGHVFVGQFFGSRGNIVLYSFGGLAIGSNRLSNLWQRIAVCLAGPLVNLIVWGLLTWALARSPRDVLLELNTRQWLVGLGIDFLLGINLYWALLNLLPVWPLDGGQIARELFVWRMPGDGVRASLWLSIITAGAFAVNSLSAYSGKPLIPYIPAGGLYSALLFASLALSNYFELQQTPTRSRSWQNERTAPWERDPDYWKQ